LSGPLALTYRSTHFFLLDVVGGKLLVDAGWPGSLPELASRLKAYRLDGRQIRYVLPTHFHPDHAGLVQEVKQTWGARMIVHKRQVPYIPQLAVQMAKKGGYVPVQVEPHDLVLTDDNRARLKALGLNGIVVPTPGHSEDSVSLVLDSGEALIGDLPPPHFLEEPTASTVRASWQTLIDHGARTVYPSHTPPAPIETIRALLES
jgi:endoribonuclease LACTB2